MFCVPGILKTGLIAIALFLLLTSYPVTAQLPGEVTPTGFGGSNTIYGTILTAGGQRLVSRVSVKLISERSGDRVAVTNERGVFAFSQLPTGTYVIAIEKEEHFEPFTQYVEIVQRFSNQGSLVQVSIQLKPKRSALSIPSVVNAGLADVPEQALDLYQKAEAAAKAGDRKASIELLEKALKIHPLFYVAQNELGIQYLRIGNLIKAEQAFGQALEIQPDAALPMLYRGIILVELRRYKEAEPLLQKSVVHDQKSLVGHYYFGVALANLGKFDQAQKHLSTAVTSRSPAINEGRRILAIIYASMGKKKEAATELERYLKVDPAVPDAEKLRELVALWKN